VSRLRWTCLLLFACGTFTAAAFLVVATVEADASTKHCESVQCYRKALRWQKHEVVRLHRRLVAKTHTDVVAAIRLAANVSGVSFRRLWTISGCESGHDPYAVLGQYQGLFQLGRYHRGFPEFRGVSPFNPYANAIHAAMFIARNGESQWSCRSDGRVAY
jgi:hypothetical protein